MCDSKDFRKLEATQTGTHRKAAPQVRRTLADKDRCGRFWKLETSVGKGESSLCPGFL